MMILWWVQAFWPTSPYSSYDFAHHFEKVRLLSKPHPAVRICEWQALEPSVLKFNVDGSSLGNPGPSGIGGVIRNDMGMVLGVFSKASSGISLGL